MSQKQPHWTLEIIAEGNPARVSLGIDWGDMLAKPVEFSVPLDILCQGAERIAGYYLELCQARACLREALPGLEFEDSIN